MALNREDKADVSKAMGKAIANKVSKVTKDKPTQVSKEYFGGKWQKVGFYEGKNGKVDVRPMTSKSKALKLKTK